MINIAELASNEDMLSYMEQVDLHRCLCDAMATLSPAEQRVIRLRFGLEGGTKWTLDDAGKELKLTGERIRQIEAMALRKLRHPTRSRKLKDYV